MRATLSLLVAAALCVAVLPVAAQQLLQVTNTTTKNQQGPKISADGSTIIWGQQDPSKNYQHYIFAADNQLTTIANVRQLTFDPYASNSFPSQWQISGDGSLVVFHSSYDLWSVPTSGGTPTQLTNFSSPPGIVNVAYPISLSHDGRLACFTYFFYQSSPTTIRTYDVYVVDTQTKAITNITKSPANSNDLAMGWISADGKTVTFIQYRGGSAREVWLAASDGTNLRQLTTLGSRFTFYPQIDASAKTCVFESRVSGQYEIYTIQTDGSNLTSISLNPLGQDRIAALSADGDRVTWKSDVKGQGGGFRELYMAYPEGSGQRQISQHGDITPSTGNYGHALNGDGTMAVFNSKANWQGGNPDGNYEVYLFVDGMTRSGAAKPGATVVLNMTAPQNPNETYQAACSLSRSPGIPLPGGIVPLTPDGLFFLSIAAPTVFKNFSGTLSATGTGSCQIDIPNDPNLPGLAFYTSFITVAGTRITVFNPVKITIS